LNLEEIRERVEYAPRLLVSLTNEGGYEHPASVYEEEDGLNTLCYLPGEYGEDYQNELAREIVNAYEDRARLLAALETAMSYGNEYTRRDLAEIVDETIKNWKPRAY
jgi:hypothetical protein